jgi:hypothetical protein
MSEQARGIVGAYQAPRAMRLQAPRDGMGSCEEGSGDAQCISDGSSAFLQCQHDGQSAGVPGGSGECVLDGLGAISSCNNDGLSVV